MTQDATHALGEAGPRVLGPHRIGADALIAPDVILGHPAKATLVARRAFAGEIEVVIGRECILRSGTVLYEDVELGDGVQTAHHVVVREGVRVGDGCVLGNGTVLREGARLGRNVRLMEGVVIAEGAVLGNDVFVGPNVTFTAGRQMTGALEAAGRMTHEEAVRLEGKAWEGPSVVVEDDVRIGAGATVLAGVRIGRGCIVAAGSLVSKDVHPFAVVAGMPARLVAWRDGQPHLEAR
jgi:acetyltransferase-like isoleucine patch superfamily enzyme